MDQKEVDFMLMPVPYYSQREEEALKTYGSKACGITSLRMVLAYYGKVFDVQQMDEMARRVGAYEDKQGWIHSGLVSIARDAGLNGYRINFDFLSDQDRTDVGSVLAKEGASLNEIHSFMETFDEAKENGVSEAINHLLENKIPIITSMKEEFADTTASHLVVIIGKEDNKYLVNDPWHNGKNFEAPEDQFNQTWTKRAIVIYPK